MATITIYERRCKIASFECPIALDAPEQDFVEAALDMLRGTCYRNSDAVWALEAYLDSQIFSDDSDCEDFRLITLFGMSGEFEDSMENSVCLEDGEIENLADIVIEP